VVTLGMDGKDHADRFLTQLRKHDRNQWDFIRKRIRAVANHDRYANELTFKHVGEGVFEFKRPGIRLYAFYDEIDEIGHLILCTNGGGKGNRKEQNADIQSAKTIRNAYFSAKLLEDTRIILAEPKP
jgi:putative component of toxin-antitoxin plasmid stabilization module